MPLEATAPLSKNKIVINFTLLHDHLLVDEPRNKGKHQTTVDLLFCVFLEQGDLTKLHFEL